MEEKNVNFCRLVWVPSLSIYKSFTGPKIARKKLSNNQRKIGAHSSNINEENNKWFERSYQAWNK